MSVRWSSRGVVVLSGRSWVQLSKVTHFFIFWVFWRTLTEAVVTEPTNYTKLSKKIIRPSRRFSKLKPV